jgi:FAD binding domain in molybdopterin dehydrogenase
VIRHRFEYRAPREIEDALQILARAGDDCAVLGGGTWLIPNMTFAAHQPKVVLDPKYLDPALISEFDDDILIGARTTYADALRSALVSKHLPLLASMASGITGGISITAAGDHGRVCLLWQSVVGRSGLSCGVERAASASIHCWDPRRRSQRLLPGKVRHGSPSG